MADWSSIAGQLASLGASTETMNVALQGVQQQYAPPGPGFTQPGFPDPLAWQAQQQAAAAQQQAFAQLLNQQARSVEVSTLDLSGLWVGAPGAWVEVSRTGNGYSYIAKTIIDIVVETGTMCASGNSIAVSGRNQAMGEFRAVLSVVNEDLLILVQNGVVGFALRRISASRSKPYLG